MVVWLIGMSGAGKTVIGQEVSRLLRTTKPNVVFLDGDSIREVMGNDLGHSLEDRRKNAGRICRLCRLLDSQGIDVVCSILSIFSESRAWNRKHLPQYFEVYIKVPFDELVRRDAKGIYKQALKGEIKDVVGVDIPFEPPAQPDLVVENTKGIDAVAQFAKQIVSLLPKGKT